MQNMNLDQNFTVFYRYIFEVTTEMVKRQPVLTVSVEVSSVSSVAK